MVTNTYRNIPTEDKIKLYLRFCDYLAKEQIEYGEGKKKKKESRTSDKDKQYI